MAEFGEGGFINIHKLCLERLWQTTFFSLPLCLLGFVSSASGDNGPSCTFICLALGVVAS